MDLGWLPLEARVPACRPPWLVPSATLPPAISAESDASAGRCGATRGCLKTHPSGLSVRNAPCRSRKRALPLGAHQCQARPCRLRPVRKATRRPGAAGRRGAVVPGQCVQGRPAPPKARATQAAQVPWGCATAHGSGTSLLGRRTTGTTPTWRPRCTSSTGTGRRVAPRRSDGTTAATGGELRAGACCWYLLQG